jgi:hypothetical protein
MVAFDLLPALLGNRAIIGIQLPSSVGKGCLYIAGLRVLVVPGIVLDVAQDSGIRPDIRPGNRLVAGFPRRPGLVSAGIAIHAVPNAAVAAPAAAGVRDTEVGLDSLQLGE